jgi:(+)-neomenthol dehydrogenase
LCRFVFRVAVVTGRNNSEGLEVCRQLASKGVMVILTARDEKKGSEVDMLHGSGLPDVQFHRLDVSDPTDAARLAEFIQEKFGRLDILVSFF